MNFEQRARKARQRGQPVRAAVLLIEGLKRHSGNASALAYLLEIYVEDLSSAGLGYDLTGILLSQPDARSRFDRLQWQLHERGKDSMGREIVRAAAENGVELEWPPAQPAVQAVPADEPLEGEPGESRRTDEPSHKVAPTPDLPGEEPLDEDLPALDSSAAAEQVGEEASFDGGEQATVEPAAEAPEPDVPSAPTSSPSPSPEQEPASEQEPAPEQEPSPVRAEKSQQSEQTPPPDEPEDPPKQSRSPGPGRKSMIAVALFVAALAALGAYQWFGGGDELRDGGQLDRSIAKLDPDDKSQIEELFSGYDPQSLPVGVAERRAFVRAVYAADWGQASASVPSKTTVWGMAAEATSRALQGDFEQALSAAARLERSHGDELAAVWALGFVDEARGRYANAVRHYGRGQEQFPEFAPFVVGQLRVHTRQGRVEEVERLKAALGQMSPNNPYANMPVAIPSLGELAPRPTPRVEPGAGEDAGADARGNQKESAPRFVRAVAGLQRSVEATGNADYDSALAYAEEALEREPQLGPALLIAGVLRAANLDVKTSTSAFTRLIQIPGLTSSYRWMLQIAASRALLGAGQATLAYQFVPPVKAAGRVTDRAAGADSDERPFELPEPIVPLLSIEQKLVEEPLARQALLARVEVLSALGLEQAALESLELLDGHAQELAGQAGMVRTILAIRRGSRRDARSAARSLAEEKGGHAARAALAYFRGDYAEAINHARTAKEGAVGPDDLAVLRILALSLTADSRGREALSVLDTAQVAVMDRAGLEALRMRVLGRVGPGVDGSTTRYDSFAGLQPTSIDRLIDLAEVAFWQKNFDDARQWAEEALALGPKHPEANWLLGLIEQIEGSEKQAKRRFRAAWREDPNEPTLLIELGRIYLSLDEPRRAQKSFYKALLRDRGNVEAIAGLGKAYLRYDRSIGIRDLSRIQRGYGGSSRYVAPSTEALTWLAILNGSREGSDKGLGYLDRAAELMGDSPALLIERARYRQARKEYDTARKLYARALEKNSTLAEARIGLARMAIRADDVDVARTQLQRYLALAPDGDDARWAREQLDQLNEQGGGTE